MRDYEDLSLPRLEALVDHQVISKQDLADLMNNDLAEYFEAKLESLIKKYTHTVAWGWTPDPTMDLVNLVRYIRREPTTSFLWEGKRLEEIGEEEIENLFN